MYQHTNLIPFFNWFPCRKFVTLDNAQTVLKVTTDLLEETKKVAPTSSMTSSVLCAAHTISAMYHTFKESCTFTELSKYDVSIVYCMHVVLVPIYCSLVKIKYAL